MGVAFVPLYVSVLGAEAYGLIGIYTILQAGMTLFDFGLTPTLNREMARLRGGGHSGASIRDLLRSLEMIYALLAVAVAIVVWLGAAWLAAWWIKSDLLRETAIVNSFRVMGLVLASRWLEQVYRGALQGLQDLVWLNIAQAILASIRWGGAYVVIALVSPTVITFFFWQVVVSILTVAILIRRTYRLLPETHESARFNLKTLMEIRRFASGMFLGTFLSFLLTQADKVVISKLLPLKQLAYYTLAGTVANGLLQLINPMNTAVYPRLTDLVTRNANTDLELTYQRACEWMAAIIIPPALLLAFFPKIALVVWTGNPELSEYVAPLLSLLALGTLCNGLMNLPYMLQLAHGWIGLAVRVNFAAVVIVIPSLIWAVPRYGAIGAGATWLALNASYLIIAIHLMHSKISPNLKWNWYRYAVIQPLVLGGTIGALLRLVLPAPSGRLASGCVLLVSAAFFTIPIFAVLPTVRETSWRGTLGIISPIVDHIRTWRQG
jgi:O-antigen/teichoic acid export membrane protein